MELARTVCELLRWGRPNGKLQAHECRESLERLDAEGTLVLPDKLRGRAVGSVTRVPRTAAGEPGHLLGGTVCDIEPLAGRAGVRARRTLLFRELLDATTTSGTRSPSAPTCAIWCWRYSLEVRRRVAEAAVSRSFDEALFEVSRQPGHRCPRRVGRGSHLRRQGRGAASRGSARGDAQGGREAPAAREAAVQPRAHALVEPEWSESSALNRCAIACAAMPRAW